MPILPATASALVLDHLDAADECITLTLRTTCPSAPCPVCCTTPPATPLQQHRLQSLEANCRCAFATLLATHGDHAAARTMIEQAIQLARSIGNRYVEQPAITAYAEMLENAGWFEQALHYRTQALQMARDTEVTKREAIAHNNLAGVLIYLGLYERASMHAHEALRLFDGLGNPWLILQTLSSSARYLGEYKEALTYAHRCVEAVGPDGDHACLSEGLLVQGDALLDLERLHEAEAAYTHVLALARAANNEMITVTALARLAHVALVCEQPQRALAYADESLACSTLYVLAARWSHSGATGHAMRHWVPTVIDVRREFCSAPTRR